MNGMTQYIKDTFDLAKTDKSESHSYEYMYASVFSNFIPQSLLEIGVKSGRSIYAWQKLFPKAEITGIDISKNNLITEITKDSFKYLIGDSTVFDVSTLPVFDIIIDDGSHKVEDQIKTFKNFKEKFKYYYVIEDINFVKNHDHTSDLPLKKLIASIQEEGFYGIATYPSYNKRKETKSLVVMSKDF
jgi:hypothetical protein